MFRKTNLNQTIKQGDQMFRNANRTSGFAVLALLAFFA